MRLSDYIKADPGRGRQSALCKRVGAHAPDMSRWISGERPIPEAKCVLIELHSGGESTCEENRPDINWSRIPDPAWPHLRGRPVIDVARPVGGIDRGDAVDAKPVEHDTDGTPFKRTDFRTHADGVQSEQHEHGTRVAQEQRDAA